MDEIYEQLDALTIPELNCTLRFDFIPWGNERKQNADNHTGADPQRALDLHRNPLPEKQFQPVFDI